MGYDAVLPGEKDFFAGLSLLSERGREGVPFVCLNLESSRGTPVFPPLRRFSRGGLDVVVTGLLGDVLPKGSLDRLGLRVTPPREALERFLRGGDAAAADVVIVLSHQEPSGDAAMARGAPRPLLVFAGHTRNAPAGPVFQGRSVFFRTAGRGMSLLEVSVGKPGAAVGEAGFGNGDLLAFARARGQGVPGAPASGGGDTALTRREQAGFERMIREESAKRMVFRKAVPLDAAVPDDPGMASMHAAYKKDLTRLAAASRPETQRPSDYLGTPSCARCHGGFSEAWKSGPHARAYVTLGRQGDAANPDCVGCHVTGYGKGGFRLGPGGARGFAGVGCEACHGPGRGHPGRTMTIPDERACGECHGALGPFPAAEKIRGLSCVRAARDDRPAAARRTKRLKDGERVE